MEKVKTFSGEEIDLKAYQESLRVTYPHYIKPDIDDQGTPFLTGCTFQIHQCGCEIEGNGTLQFPLRIKFCEQHTNAVQKYIIEGTNIDHPEYEGQEVEIVIYHDDGYVTVQDETGKCWFAQLEELTEIKP